MERYTGKYNYTPMRKGIRTLVKKDGTFPPPDVPADTICLTASTTKYRMVTIGDIRILDLLPGSFADPLACRLRTAALEDAPTYDALSYMWGDASLTGAIMLDGEVFPVTSSLENALRHVRHNDSVLHLWADAVCINQCDVKEKWNQIHLMKEIYSRSATVRVWIDVELPREDLVVHKLFTLRVQSNLDQLGDDPGFWEPLLPLVRNPYWDRLWIQQELAFAQKLEFHCRGVTIPGDCVMAFQLHVFRKLDRSGSPFDVDDDAWSVFSPQGATSKAPSRNLACWREMIKTQVPVDPHTLRPDYSLRKPEVKWQLDPLKMGPWLSTSPIYLLGMLRLSQTLKVTDPKDRVNATLNLVLDYEDDGEEHNSYEKSLAENYLSVARLLPFKCNSLLFLGMARTPTIPDATVQGLPSWAPNWNPPGNAEYFLGPFCAAGDLPMYNTPFQEDMEDGILHARGFRAVKFVYFHHKVYGMPLSDIKKLSDTLAGPAIAEFGLGRKYFSRNEAILYAGILLMYSFISPGLRIVDLLPYTTNTYEQSQRNLTTALQSLRPFRHHLPSCLCGLDLEKLSAAIRSTRDQTERFGHFVRLVHKTLSSGCLGSISSPPTLAITEGTADVRPGDEVWILFGCPVPMVLRRTGSYFGVVSPAYIADIMNGEAMDGVYTPDEKSGGWFRILKDRRFSPASAYSYQSGRGKWLVEVIRLR